MAMYANIGGVNKLLAQTVAEMTAAGGGYNSCNRYFVYNINGRNSVLIFYRQYNNNRRG